MAFTLYIGSFPCAQLPDPVHTARLDRVCMFYIFSLGLCFACLLLAGCHGNLPVLNLLSASVTKNQHFRRCRKNYALDRKMIDTF